MSCAGSRVAVIGGRSAIAMQLRRKFFPEGTYFVRVTPSQGEREVRDYRAIAAPDLATFDVVINCAGVTAGSESELRRANVELPLALAHAAREAGASTFVHISSFSVYGREEVISQRTATQPVCAYGRSKLAADEALLALECPRFRPVIVRFPAVIDPDRRKGKVRLLISVLRRIHYIPLPTRDVRRSMISSSLSARVLADLVQASESKLVLAADPQPFTYRQVIQAIRGREGAKLARAILMPEIVFSPLALAAPSLHQSLFTDSLLEPGSNFAMGYPSDLYKTIEDMATGLGRS